MIEPNNTRLDPELEQPISIIKGIGPKRTELLSQKGLKTVRDLFYFLPIRYEDKRRVMSINKTQKGESALVRGRVLFGGEERFFRTGKRLFRIVITDDTAPLELLWFHYKKAHLSRFTREGLELFAYGRVQENLGKRQMTHPELSPIVKPKDRGFMGLIPVYSYIEGISGKTIRSAIRDALDHYLDLLIDPVPKRVLLDLGLPELKEAIRGIHCPHQNDSLELLNLFKSDYHRRLVFDRFFSVMLSIFIRKKNRKKRKGPAFSIPGHLMRRLESFFPFILTQDQVRAIQDITEDLASDAPMNRLLQGDVACGKTVVAAVAAHVTTYNGWQVALMAPTQVLAQQHYGYFYSLPQEMGLTPVLLTGALKKPERIKIYENIRCGKNNVIIGTQALIHKGLTFQNLGLVIIDEQHRFGVSQRAGLDEKGSNPNVLVMTATPIPRTLAMTVYADLDLSIIKEYPQGRCPVKTLPVDEHEKRNAFNTLKHRISVGEQAMVICPAIEESDEADLKNVHEMVKKLQKILSPAYRIGVIHGRMPSEDKDRVMEQFREGQVDVLVGTTVVEVGVHAPGATLMIIEHPERYGLTQLHQLRGRGGRGSKEGLCLLMLSRELPENTLSRLRVLLKTHDGFEIAQKDLEMRGQGQLMGTRQAGAGELDLGEMFREPDLLLDAKKAAETVLEEDPTLSKPENRFLRSMIQKSSSTGPLDF